MQGGPLCPHSQMPKSMRPPPQPEKRTISYRLPVDLIDAVAAEAMDDARGRTSGRMYNPSAVVERILRAHFDAKPKRSGRTK